MAVTAKPKTNVLPPATLAKPAPTAAPKISPPPATKDPFSQYGGKDSYVASQTNRYNQAVKSGDTGLQDRLRADASRAGYSLPGGAPAPASPSMSPDLSWIGAGANSEIAAQLAAYQGQQEAARLAMQQGIDANNSFLAEQTAALQKQQVVSQDALQQQQNRFGGLYSGGLNYQSGHLNSAFAQQQGSLQRDVAARNNALQQQYGSQANTIAQQISQLQASAPQVINERIQNYLMQYADQYGVNPLTGQSTLAGKNANLNAALSIGEQTGRVVNPQSDWSGLIRQAQSGNAPLTRTAQQQAFENDLAMQEAEIYKQVQLGNLDIAQAQLALDDLKTRADISLNWAQERRYAANQSSGGSGGGGASKPSTESVIEDINMPRTASTMETYIIKNLPGGKEVFGPPSPYQQELIEDMILSNPNLSEADTFKLYKKFGIPIPE